MRGFVDVEAFSRYTNDGMEASELRKSSSSFHLVKNKEYGPSSRYPTFLTDKSSG